MLPTPIITGFRPGTKLQTPGQQRKPGHKPGQFNVPNGIAVDGQGNIYVTDAGNYRIQTWNKATITWTATGSLGTNPGQFNEPYGVAVDGQGNIDVADTDNHRIQIWDKAKNTWTTTGSEAQTPDNSYALVALLWTARATYTSPTYNHRIQCTVSYNTELSMMVDNLAPDLITGVSAFRRTAGTRIR